MNGITWRSSMSNFTQTCQTNMETRIRNSFTPPSHVWLSLRQFSQKVMLARQTFVTNTYNERHKSPQTIKSPTTGHGHTDRRMDVVVK